MKKEWENIMKKLKNTMIILTAVIMLVLLSAPQSFAETSGKIVKNTVTVDMYIADVGNYRAENAVFALYTPEGICIDTQSIHIANTGIAHRLTFNTPEYTPGQIFLFSCLGGARAIQYCDDFYKAEDKIPLQTYYDYVTEEDKTVYGHEFILTAFPNSEKSIKTVVNSAPKKLTYPPKIVNNSCMLSLPDIMKVFNLMDYHVISDEKSGRIEINAYGKTLVLALGVTEVQFYGTVILDAAPLKIDGIIYLPLRFVAEAFGAEVSAEEITGELIVNIKMPSLPYAAQNTYINDKDISSQTEYLLWVSKKDYTVTLFCGSKNCWEAVTVMPCTIGAPSSPTITGEYKYFSKEKQWSYAKYYVGPIMRFYRGYAFHSTLLKYDGTAYDARLQQQLSHGCVRMAPADINYLAETVPLYTKVYITN